MAWDGMGWDAMGWEEVWEEWSAVPPHYPEGTIFLPPLLIISFFVFPFAFWKGIVILFLQGERIYPPKTGFDYGSGPGDLANLAWCRTGAASGLAIPMQV